jgi:ligand-binding sensor domain-containing protein
MKQWSVPAVALALPLCLIAESLPIRSYSTTDGLAADTVNRIVVDSFGFTWFATTEGLSRFDGYRFVNFGVADGLPHRVVNTLLETRSGEFLIGTDRGLSVFQAGGRGNFTTYLPGTNAENAINALYQDSAGRIWCGTWAGLFEMLSGHRFRRRPLTPASGNERILVSDVREDARHNPWVGTRTGVYVIGGDGAVQHIALGYFTENVRALLPDRFGGMWAGTQGGLILIEADKNGGYAGAQLYKEVERQNLDVTSLENGSDGATWAGASAGIVRWLSYSRPSAFTILTRAQGLIDRQVDALAADRAGNMWAATEAAGAMQIRRGGFTTFRQQDGLKSDRVWSILADLTGTVLAVTAEVGPFHDSINRFDGSSFHALSLKGFSDRPGFLQATLCWVRAVSCSDPPSVKRVPSRCAARCSR